MLTKIKYIGTIPATVLGQSYRGPVKDNDIIEVNDTDLQRLLGKRHNDKPVFELDKSKKAEPKKEPAKQDEK